MSLGKVIAAPTNQAMKQVGPAWEPARRGEQHSRQRHESTSSRPCASFVQIWSPHPAGSRTIPMPNLNTRPKGKTAAPHHAVLHRRGHQLLRLPLHHQPDVAARGVPRRAAQGHHAQAGGQCAGLGSWLGWTHELGAVPAGATRVTQTVGKPYGSGLPPLCCRSMCSRSPGSWSRGPAPRWSSRSTP